MRSVCVCVCVFVRLRGRDFDRARTHAWVRACPCACTHAHRIGLECAKIVSAVASQAELVTLLEQYAERNNLLAAELAAVREENRQLRHVC